MLSDRTSASQELGFVWGLVPIPKPIPIPQPMPLPTPGQIPMPMQMPRPSVLPGTATQEQYLPQTWTAAPLPPQAPPLTESGTPAIGQYLPAPVVELAPGQTAPGEVPPPQPVMPQSTSQINLPPPESFWRQTQAAMRISIPSPQDYWSGVPTTNQIVLPTPEVLWQR